MKISVLCSDAEHPVNAWIRDWAEANSAQHEVSVIRSRKDLRGGELLFLISCSEIITPADRDMYATSLVVHASDLPDGRGWSPHVWQLIEGASSIVVTLLEAADKVDEGRIWQKISVAIPRHALFDEVNALIFEAELRLMDFAVDRFGGVESAEQERRGDARYFRRRTPADSELDPADSISNQFDLIRVCDPTRYPAFFRLRGHKYTITLEKSDD